MYPHPLVNDMTFTIITDIPMATAVAVTTAVLENPNAFADAARTFVKAQGSAIKNADKAIDVLKNARGFILDEKAEHARIINLSDKKCTWYCYNSLTALQFMRFFQSYMGEWCTVACTSRGYMKMMNIYKDNRNPAHLVERGKVYIFNGEKMTEILLA